MLLRTAQATEIFLGSRSNENAHFFAFAILRCYKNGKKSVYSGRQSIWNKKVLQTWSP